MPLWEDMGGDNHERGHHDGTEQGATPATRAALDQHLTQEDCDGLDRAVVIELGETCARTTAFVPDAGGWSPDESPVGHSLRRSRADRCADLSAVAADARQHIRPAVMTDFVLTGTEARNRPTLELFRDRLGRDRVFVTAPTSTRTRNILVGAGAAVVLIVVALVAVGVATRDEPTETDLASAEAGVPTVLGATTERTAAPTTAPTAAPATAPTPSTAPATTLPTPTTALTALGPIDQDCAATVFEGPGATGASWSFEAGEHDLLLEPRALVRSVEVTGAGCHVEACTEWAGAGLCAIFDEGAHDVAADLADGVSHLRVG